MARRFRSAPGRLSVPFVERSGGGRMNEMLDSARIAAPEPWRSAPPATGTSPQAGTSDNSRAAQGGAAPSPPSSQPSPPKGGEGAGWGEREPQGQQLHPREEGRGGAHRTGMR